MSKDDHLNKLKAVVENKTKFTFVEKDKRISYRYPLIRITEHISEMIKQNLKPHVDKKTYINLITGGNSTTKSYGPLKRLPIGT